MFFSGKDLSRAIVASRLSNYEGKGDAIRYLGTILDLSNHVSPFL